MNKLMVFSGVLLICISLPISMYLQFWLIAQNSPDRLIWFLYWINVPVIIFSGIVKAIVEGKD